MTPAARSLPLPVADRLTVPLVAATSVAVSVPPAMMAMLPFAVSTSVRLIVFSSSMLIAPAPVTLAMLPYAQGVADLAQAASARGHELLVHVPMQPSYGANPGPQALLLDQTPEERQRLLQWNLAQFSGYVGINNHMGSQFTEDSAALRPVIETVRAANLLFLDSRTTVHTAGRTLASELAVPFAERDVFLDNHRNADYLALQLAQVEAIARRRGLAVAIGHPHEVTLAALAAWLPRLDARGFALTSVRAVAQRA